MAACEKAAIFGLLASVVEPVQLFWDFICKPGGSC
jgi:hypothetical protein